MGLNEESNCVKNNTWALRHVKNIIDKRSRQKILRRLAAAM